MSNKMTLSQIPTLSQLYLSGELEPVEYQPPTSEPSVTINSKISIIRTSITDLEVTSIVNAANNSLLGGGGVDGAIHNAAGPGLLAECRALDGCDTGSAKITAAYELPSKYVIHAVGPVYARQKQERSRSLLQRCYHTSLKLAAEKGGSIAFSCLSTGVYGYPSDEAAEVACETVRDFFESGEGEKLERVVFCCFLEKDMVEYGEILPIVFPPTKEELPASIPSSRESPGVTTEAPEDEKWVKVENLEPKVDDQSHVETDSKDTEDSASGTVSAGEKKAHLKNRLADDW
ncbi:MAG: hypothetical protein Q9212_002124 [Teloschistes hypoglaucus]